MTSSEATTEIDDRIAALYGRVEWRDAGGVIQVAAIADTTRSIIALGPSAPPSETDRFILGWARARADAIVTTGSILRAEPDLVHRYHEAEALDRGLADWRRRVLGRSAPPSLVVLSASGDFDPDHPALAAAESGFVWTSESGGARLGNRLARLDVEIPPEGRAPTVAGALALAFEMAVRPTLLIEAGPSTSESLYPKSQSSRRRAGEGNYVEELLLSNFEGELAESAIGPDFLSSDRVGRHLGRPLSSVRKTESSGAWRFERYRA